MTLTLRQESDVRATTKGSALTYAEMDANFLHALDTGIIVVGSDSSGATLKLGDTIKFANATVSGNTVTVNDISADTTPQLGGNLDAQSNNITAVGKMEITNTSTDDSLLLTTTEASSTAAPVITFKRNSGSPADADYLGQLKFKGENDNDQEVVYAKMTAKISDASDTTEDGLLEFALMKAGSNNIGARLTSTALKLLNGTDLDLGGETITTTTTNGDIGLVPNGNGKVDVGTGSATATISSNGAHNLKLETNDGTNSASIEIEDATNGGITLKPNGNGNIKLGSGTQALTVTTEGAHDLKFDTNDGTDTPSFTIKTGIHANDSGPDRGILEFDSKGLGGAVFINNEDAQSYPTGAMILRNNGANDAEIHFGQFGQGPAVGKSGDNTLFFSVYFDPDAKAFSHSDSSSFPGDANVFFGYDFENNQAIMQGNGGGNGFKIDSFGNNSASYANGPIVLAGSYAEIDGSDKYLEFKNRSGDPSTPSGAAIQYAKGGEMFVKDASGNVTQISPHNDQGEWEYFSRNTETGKTVKVNMEKMIRKLEQITGETFFEEFKPARS